MKKNFIWCWCVVLISSMFCCGGKEEPKGILSHADMVFMLSEVLITEEKVNRLALSNDSASQVFKTLRGKVFMKAGIQDSVFKKSMNYYIDHPKEMEEIYTVLVDSLNLREQRASVLTDKK